MDIYKEITEKSFNNKVDLQRQIDKALSDRNLELDEPLGFQTEGVFFGQQPPKLRIDQYLAAATGWVYGCVSRIANSVANIEIELYQINSKGEIEEVENHPAIDLLDKVNDHTTRFDHFNLTQQYLELAGEAPWYIDRGENGDSEPQTIMLLRPDRLTIIQNEDKNSTNPIAGYSYKVDAENELMIKPSEIVFLKYPDPTNYFRGKGTLAAAARTVDIDNFSEEYNKRFFYNSARPDMVLSSDQKLSTQQRQTLQSSIRKLYQGGEKAHKTLILESGLSATPFSMSPKEMDFLAQQQYDMSKIFSIFGVPKSVMSVSDDVNMANAKVGEYVFMKYTVVPKLKKIVAQLNEFYLPMFDGAENMFFSFDDPVPQDTESDIKRFDSALSKGYMTHNEVRSELNLPDIGPEGDVLLIPFGFTPIDSPQSNGAPSGPTDQPTKQVKIKSVRKAVIGNSMGGYKAATKGLQKVKERKAQKDKATKILKEADEKIDNLARAMVKKMVADKKLIAKKELQARDEMIKEYEVIYLRASKNYERAFTVGMQTIFGEQAKKVLGKLPKKAKDVTIDDYLIDEEDESILMVRVFSPLTKRVIKDSGERAAKLVGDNVGFSLATKPVQDYLKERIYKFSFEVNQETNKLIANALQEGVGNGEGIPKLRARIKDLFDNMENYRAERIARSEVIRASNFAATEAYDQSGVVEKIQWLATEDDRIDEECAGLDGTIISLGDGFTENSYDGSVEYPPLHPNCRCTVIPIVS